MSARRLSSVPDPDRNRAVAYIRVSAVMGRQVEEFHSPELQHRAITDMLGRRGLREVVRVEDIDRTGRDFNREGIQQVFDLARSGQIDVVAIADLSRLGRNTAESLRAIKDLRELGVSVLSTAEQIDDTPEGQFQLGVLLGVAQLYSDQQGRKWRQVHEFMATDGRQVGQPPIGYLQSPTGKTTLRGREVRSGPAAIDPVMGPAVAQAFKDYATGARVRDIAARLGELRGKPVWASQVRVMFSRRFYLGFVTYMGAEFQGQHEPLVDAVTWKACQRRKARDAGTPARRLQIAHSLSGIAVCAGCESKVALSIERGKGPGRLERLICNHHREFHNCPGDGCGAMRVTDIEAYVLDWLRNYLRELKVDTTVQAAHRSRQAVAKANAAHLRAEMSRNRQALAKLALNHSAGLYSNEQFADAQRDLLAAAERLRTAVAEAESMQGMPPRKAITAIAEVLELWPDATAQQRNRMLRDVIGEVRLRRSSFYRQPTAQRVTVVPL